MSMWCEFCRKTDHETVKCWGQGTVAIQPEPPWYRLLDKQAYHSANRSARRAMAKQAKRDRPKPGAAIGEKE